MLIFAIWKSVATYLIYINGETTEATIIDYNSATYNQQSSTGSSLTHSPIYTFTTSEGKNITLYAGSANKVKKYAIGDKVKVYYPKKNPRSAKLEGYFPWKMYTILGVAGLLGVVLFGKKLQ
ncbi:DUF3592 domain-containing protein [Aurantibacter crassamenti]|nr:DUF3592 domain-containing protein [Aurantibacter crassamenti]